jgi:hypothetical protein
MLIIHHVCGCPKITFFSIFERLWAFGQVGEIETTITFKRTWKFLYFRFIMFEEMNSTQYALKEPCKNIYVNSYLY